MYNLGSYEILKGQRIPVDFLEYADKPGIIQILNNTDPK